MDISRPASKNYGKHLSKEEVHAIFAPADETVKIVKGWLLERFEESDIIWYDNKGWLAVDMPARDAEMLFGTEYYEHETDNGVRIGCDEYYFPTHVANHVDFVIPGVKLSAPLKKRRITGIENRSGVRAAPSYRPPRITLPRLYPVSDWQVPPGPEVCL